MCQIPKKIQNNGRIRSSKTGLNLPHWFNWRNIGTSAANVPLMELQYGFPINCMVIWFNLLKNPMFSIVFIHSFPFTIGFSQFLPCFPHQNPQKNIRGLRCFPSPPRRPSPSCRTWSATANRSGNACAPRWNRTRFAGKNNGEMCLWENGQLVGG